MYIEKFICQENNATGDWLVKGDIHIRGEFSRDEWEKIKTAFVALGLAQLGKGGKPSERVPSRAEFTDAMMEDARNNNNMALRRLKAKYHMPEMLDAANGE